MSEIPSPLVVLLDEEEAQRLAESPIEGSNQYLLRQMKEFLKNGKRRVALTDEQLGRVIQCMTTGEEPTHKMWLSVFRRPLLQMLEQVSEEPPARME